MDKKTFVDRFLKPENSGEWATLIAMILVTLGVIIFLFFAYTRWRYM